MEVANRFNLSILHVMLNVVLLGALAYFIYADKVQEIEELNAKLKQAEASFATVLVNNGYAVAEDNGRVRLLTKQEICSRIEESND